MRVNRIRKTKITRKRRIKLLMNFFVLLPTLSIISGYIITDLIVLPMYYK